MRTLWRAALTLLVLGACTAAPRKQYILHPPPQKTAAACIASCETPRAKCRADADVRAMHERNYCDRNASDDYEGCVLRSGMGQEQSRCYRGSCALAADYEACDVTYRVCFQGCGGTVEERIVCEGDC